MSSAVLRLVSTDPRSAESAGAGEPMQEMLRPVLSRDSLAEIIQSPALQLYAPERRRRPLDEVVRRMRDRDLRVTPLRDSPFGGRPTAFRISFEYSDAAKAYSSVQAIVAKFVEGAPLRFVTLASTAASPRMPPAAYLELLDAASLPEPSAPTGKPSAPPAASPVCCWASPSPTYAAARLTPRRHETRSALRSRRARAAQHD